jgi:hypothetical protein
MWSPCLCHEVVVQAPSPVPRRGVAEAGTIAARGVCGQGELADDEQTATTVLTFDYALEPVIRADLVLCAPTLAKEGNKDTTKPSILSIVIV